MDFEIEKEIHAALHAAMEFVHYIICLNISHSNGVVKLQLFMLQQKKLSIILAHVHFSIYTHYISDQGIS